jgi:hypothetical protein
MIGGRNMKVKIGPYLEWWGPYQIFALFQKIGFSEDTTDRWAENSPEWFTNLCQWIYDKRKRTVKIKIDKYDTWSMDSTLALIIIPMLKQLQATKHGTPMAMFDDMDATMDPEANDRAIEKWDNTIRHMIWSFEQLIEEEHDAFVIVEGKMDMKTYPEDEGKNCTPLRWEREYEVRWDAMAAYHERIQEGLDLFGKHYRSLWD